MRRRAFEFMIDNQDLQLQGTGGDTSGTVKHFNETPDRASGESQLSRDSQPFACPACAERRESVA